MQKRSIVILAIVWLILIVAGISSAVTMALCGVFDQPAASGGPVEVTNEQYQRILRYERLDQVRDELMSKYYLPLKEDELVLGAIRGMMDAADDPYTYYYTPEEMRTMIDRSKGLYEGVGLLLSSDKDGYVTVLRVFQGSPAQQAGVMPGDRITHVNDQLVSGGTDKALGDAIDRIKQVEAKLVVLTIQRGREILTLGMTRGAVTVARTEYKVLSGNIGYIVLYDFMGDDVTGFKQAVKALKQAGVTKLVLDLRSNPGGLLSDVVEIANMLMPEGLIVYTEDRDGRRENYFSSGEYWDVDIAVLVNGMSASASEILAGALQQGGRATVIGEQTFGKGIVQTVIPFAPDGAGLQLTTATYFTPNGKSIHGIGITPDIVVKMDEGAQLFSMGARMEDDRQLIAAVEALGKKR